MNTDLRRNDWRRFTVAALVLILLLGSLGGASAQEEAPLAAGAREAGPPDASWAGASPDEASSPVPVFDRSLRLPANALNFDAASTVLTQTDRGIRWQSDYRNGAFLIVPRPADWNGTSSVALSLYFLPISSAAGNVQFFVRPRAFNPGDMFADASDITASPVPVGAANEVRKVTFTIPATDFGAKELWVITIQRNSTGETYHDDVIVTAVGLSYKAVSAAPATAGRGWPANALNYARDHTIVKQEWPGILWQSNYRDSASLTVPRPVDWDGASDVRLDLYLMPDSNGLGTVGFMIRPQAYDAGDVFSDVLNLPPEYTGVSEARQVRKLSFTIPAERFGAKALWQISIQRESTNETYHGDVSVMAVGVTYGRPPGGPVGSGKMGDLTLPANALNYSRDDGILRQDAPGFRWQADYRSAAYLTVPRAPDWDGVSNVRFHIYYMPTTSARGKVQFFIRPRAFNPGDPWADAWDISPPAVSMSQQSQIREQVFTILPVRFGSKEQWAITIQRGGAQETYADDVLVLAVGLTYSQDMRHNFLPVVKR